MKKLLAILILFLILLWIVWPIALTAVAGAIAAANGCQLNEAQINSCIVNGREMGDTLYTLGVMGWFMLVTIPTGLLALLIFLLVLLILWLVGRRRASRRAMASSDAPQPSLPPEST